MSESGEGRLHPTRLPLKAWMECGEALTWLFIQRTPKSSIAALCPPTSLPTNEQELIQVIDDRLHALKQHLTETEDPAFTRDLSWNPTGDDTILRLIAVIAWLRMAVGVTDINLVTGIVSASHALPTPEAILKISLAADRSRHVIARDGDYFLGIRVASHFGDGNRVFSERLRGVKDVPQQSVTKKTGTEARQTEEEEFKDFIRNIQIFRPAQMEQEILKRGYVSQREARRAISLIAYRHITRLKSIYVDGNADKVAPKADRLLMLGPSGSGKTHLLQLIFQDILGLPFVIWDACTLTEYPYVGAKLETVLDTLVERADKRILRAQCGAVIFDEIDKMASASSGLTPAAGPRDPAGTGAQRSLLKFLDGTIIQNPRSGKDYKSFDFDSANTLVVGAGAFSALYAKPKKSNSIGFIEARTQADADTRKPIGISDIIGYGFEPEFIGRFSRIVELNHLTQNDLLTILKKTVIPRLTSDLLTQGIDVTVEEPVYEVLASQAHEKDTGARGLGVCLAPIIQDCLFEALSADDVRGVRLVLNSDGIGYEMERKKPISPQTHEKQISQVA